ncbi:MAG TPA: tetratricopeptide repeat protein [Candidatus Tectomicrobia bacterium]|nr:tetratricopeptide repeat protein [Candidatus Tectomicrobia bacterium]
MSAGVALVPLLLLAVPVFGQDILGQAETALERWDGEEAYRLVQSIHNQRPQDPRVLALLTKASLYRGEYAEAARWGERWAEAEPANEYAKGWKAFAEQSAWAVQDFKTYTSPHFILRLQAERDGVLAEYALDALEKAYEFLGRDLGYRPSTPVRIEIFPDHQGFHAASSLSKRDIEVAGAVGICKFDKVMLLSPRVLLRGYRWLDALVHEYVHYVIVKLSDDKAPIWIHEGVAKHEESRWRSATSLYLNPLNRTLLAQALQTGEFVTFERMEPSLVRLETPQQVQLAYAEAASSVEFMHGKVGYPGLREIFREMARADTRGAKSPIEQVLAISFEAFQDEWQQFLRAKQLTPVAGVQLSQFKVVEKAERDEDRLEQEALQSAAVERDLSLGDLMRQRGRFDGAVYYYDRARKGRPDAPFVLNKLSRSLLAAQRTQEAVPHALRALEVYPDYSTSHTTLGDAYRMLGELEKARQHYEESIQINPFDPVPHHYLTELYGQAGDPEAAEREARIARRLMGR